MVLTPSTSSDFVTVNRRASCAILRAYESAPTAVTCIRPAPATTKLPDSAGSSGCFTIGSASPVSSDSSSSSPFDSVTTPSVGSWSPVRRSRMSSSTTVATSISQVSPSRTARAIGALRTAS